MSGLIPIHLHMYEVPQPVHGRSLGISSGTNATFAGRPLGLWAPTGDLQGLKTKSYQILPALWTAIRFSVLVLFAILILNGKAASAQSRGKDARISLLIATGMPGGTYYQVGLGMASLWTTKLRKMGIRVSAAISEGSKENIEAIRIADADLILVEHLFCSMAFNGTGLYRGQPLTELRSITTLWPDTVQLLIRSDKLATGKLNDLEGLSLAIGLPDSGSRFTTEMLLATLKEGKQRISLRSMSPMAGAEALRNGTVQAMDATGGVPVPLVESLLEDRKPPLGFLAITDEQMEAVRQDGWKEVFRSIIRAGTYPGQSEDVNTIGQMNLLAVASSVNSEVVYALTKSLFENLEYLAKVHPACRSISIQGALQGLDLPLHKGAVRYYRERKIKIPEHLIR
ncbi:MAG: TAXI family TRAP transporter solute-binding subunit [Desulfomonile tiedjei]|nr:TAXI family TRAP transporter solute-binding subunit [Desulfomonile tiedjei]